MSYQITDKDLLDKIVGIAREASDAIMRVYRQQDFDVETKPDNFPVTAADKAADEIIVKMLKEISDHPIISEEGEARESGDVFWLVDPLDGTKEFIKRNGSFTVNIALIEHTEPVLGVVYSPVLDLMYAGRKGQGAFKVENGKRTPIKAHFEGPVPVVAASKNHRDERTNAMLERLGKHELISIGSSLKLCYVAEGKAMLYPRLAPTYLWDTAAADAVVRAAGGRVTDTKNNLLVYEPKSNLKNPYFVVSAENSLDWQALL